MYFIKEYNKNKEIVMQIRSKRDNEEKLERD